MAFDGNLIVGILVEPLRLAVKRGCRIGTDHRGIGVEEDPVSDIDGEVLLGSRRRIAGKTKVSGVVGQVVLLRGAAGQHERREKREHCRVAGKSLHAAHGRSP